MLQTALNIESLNGKKGTLLILVVFFIFLAAGPASAGFGGWHQTGFRACNPGINSKTTLHVGDANYSRGGYTVFFDDKYSSNSNNGGTSPGQIASDGSVEITGGAGSYCNGQINTEYYGDVYFPSTGAYQFGANYDDAVQVSIDNNVVIKSSNFDACGITWTDCPGHTFTSTDGPTITSGNVNLTAGNHNIRVIFENGNGAGGGGAIGGWVGYKLAGPPPDATPPSCNSAISFSPASPTLVSNNVTITANNIYDAGRVAQVDFYVNKDPNGGTPNQYNCNNDPYCAWDYLGSAYPNVTNWSGSVNWSTVKTSHTTGTHKVAINAKDAAGNWRIWNQQSNCNGSYTLSAPSPPSPPPPAPSVSCSGYNYGVTFERTDSPGAADYYAEVWWENPNPNYIFQGNTQIKTFNFNSDLYGYYYDARGYAIGSGGNSSWSNTARCQVPMRYLTITASAASGGSISPSGSVSVSYGESRFFTISPAAGYQISGVTVDGSSVGAVSSYTFSNVTADHSISAAFTPLTYTVLTSVAPPGTGSFNPSLRSGVLYGSTASFTVSASPNYHIVSVSGCGGGLSGTTYTTGAITANCTITANFAIDTSTLTISMYDDINGDGVLQAGESNVTGKTLYVACVYIPSQTIPCPASGFLTIPSSPSIFTGLSRTDTYTFGYDFNDPNNAPYKLWTAYRIDGGSWINSPLANFPLILGNSKTVDFLVSQNSRPWVQVQDGDVYSAYSGPAAGINITVNDNPLSPYKPFFVSDVSGGVGGGLIQTPANSVSCSFGPCAERAAGSAWVVRNYAGGPAWPTELNTVTGGSGVHYEPGNLTLDGSKIGSYTNGGIYENYVVIVNGDLTIDPAGTASAGKPINAFLVARGKIRILPGPGGSYKPLIINGGLYALGDSFQTSFIFDYSLDNVPSGGNRRPAVVIKYNPAILLNATPLSQPTYTWREIAAI